jgi:acetate kinase
MNILTLNPGSNSLKFSIVQTEPGASGFGRTVVAGSYDDLGKPESAFSLLDGKRVRQKDKVAVNDSGHATNLLFDWLEHAHAGQIDRVGHRVVHGADLFNSPARISDEVIQQIESLSDLAPLHNESALRVIRAAGSRIAGDVPQIAVFDTLFHRTIPERAALYGLPLDVAARHKIRRYGFHGISHRYMLLRYAQITRRPLDEINVVTLHLEGGSSAAAIRAGKSIDTSMGFTPLEGLMMGTRCGDLDPAVVPYLMRKENLDIRGIEQFLNKKCGLLGVSGVSADTRELQKHLDEKKVDLAVEIFCYRVRKYIGAYLAALGGAEAVIFGGGISENTPYMREKIASGFDWCGATLDRNRNRDLIDKEGQISTPESKLKLWVIPTQEDLMIAKEAADLEI